MLKKSIFKFSHLPSVRNIHTTFRKEPGVTERKLTDCFFPVGDFDDDELTFKRWRGRRLLENFGPMVGFSLFTIVEFIIVAGMLLWNNGWISKMWVDGEV